MIGRPTWNGMFRILLVVAALLGTVGVAILVPLFTQTVGITLKSPDVKLMLTVGSSLLMFFAITYGVGVCIVVSRKLEAQNQFGWSRSRRRSSAYVARERLRLVTRTS